MWESSGALKSQFQASLSTEGVTADVGVEEQVGIWIKEKRTRENLTNKLHSSGVLFQIEKKTAETVL